MWEGEGSQPGRESPSPQLLGETRFPSPALVLQLPEWPQGVNVKKCKPAHAQQLLNC